MQKKVLIITGGNSSERSVSLTSARNVKQTLEQNGHKAKIYDLRDGYDPVIDLSKQFDVLFPVLHGEEGEGGKLHKFLNKIDKPIVGTRNFKGMNDAWHKISFKEYCDKNNIPTSPWKIIKTKKDVFDFGFPCVLKTDNGGSSHEVVILITEQDLNQDLVNKIFKSAFRLYIEKYIKGPEITVGILDSKALPVLEIIPPDGSWFNYENKYSGATQEIPFAPSVDKKLQKQAQEIALKIHRHFDLGTYSRTDFMTTNDNLYTLEINTIPGLTSESLLPKAALAYGINFGEFLNILLRKSQ